MLRIFRRIRETTRKKLPQMGLEFTKEDVALLFVAAGESGTQIKPIGLDDQGKFVDPVPGGFFEEGFAELF
jgi:multisubunit Na+/H+ antiporter MnhC subunit